MKPELEEEAEEEESEVETVKVLVLLFENQTNLLNLSGCCVCTQLHQRLWRL
jgi:hypothetical protein